MNEPVPPQFNIATYCVAKPAQEYPEKTALTFVSPGGTERFSYREIFDAVSRTARGLLDTGLQRGDRVVIRLTNGPDYAIAFFGAIAAGLVPLCASQLLTGEEAAFLIEDCEARCVIHADALPAPTGLPDRCRIIDDDAFQGLRRAKRLDAFADTAADDPAFLIYSSGTTGNPKGVLHAQRAAWGRRSTYEGWTGYGQDDVVLHAGQLNWTYTLTVGLMDPWAIGASAVLYDGPKDPATWPRLIREHGATVFATVPTLFRQILQSCSDPDLTMPSLRHGLSAGEPLLPELLAEWRKRTGTDLNEAFGMSECSTYISSGPATPIRPGSPGKPQPGRRVVILPVDANDGDAPLPTGEVGLLAVHRSEPALMLGYWNRPEEEAEVIRGEWFVGGDLAAFDDDGYIWFKGRNNDLMNSFGYRVSPLEVEKVILGLSGVADVAVTEVSVPGRDGVTIIAAFIIRADEGLDEDQVAEHCKAHLASYKRPRDVVFVDALPFNARGKLQRRELAKTYDSRSTR